MKKRLLIPGLLLVGIVALFSLSCSKDNSATNMNPVPADTIYIDGSAYSPDDHTVGVGSKVTWINNDAMSHTVTANDGTSFSSGNITTGSSFSYVFNSIGTYNYHCADHPSMQGKITVVSR